MCKLKQDGFVVQKIGDPNSPQQLYLKATPVRLAADELLKVAKLGLECILAETGGVEYEDTHYMRSIINKAEGK